MHLLSLLIPFRHFTHRLHARRYKGYPKVVMNLAQKMTREQALRSYTLDAAFGAFEEKTKGSIEPGKLADFTVFTRDLMTIPENQILQTEVSMTILGGKVVYQQP